MKGETAQLIDSLKGTICNEIGKIVLASFQRCSISKNLETPEGGSQGGAPSIVLGLASQPRTTTNTADMLVQQHMGLDKISSKRNT